MAQMLHEWAMHDLGAYPPDCRAGARANTWRRRRTGKVLPIEAMIIRRLLPAQAFPFSVRLSPNRLSLNHGGRGFRPGVLWPQYLVMAGDSRSPQLCPLKGIPYKPTLA